MRVKKNIYLDYAAATPVDSMVLKAMQPFFSEIFYNPSATYLAGRAARESLREIRTNLAAVIGARPAEIIFTAGATEANNLAIQGVMRQFPESEALVSAIEHESVLEPAELFRTTKIPVDSRGIVNLEKLEKLITPRTVLVSVMLVNNELGTVQPIREIAKILNKLSILRSKQRHELPLYLHSDAAQAGNYLDLHVSRLGVDLMSINGGKLYGPKQSGALYVKAGTQLRPLVVGGGQEFGLRSGTENLAAAAGLAEALRLSQELREQESKRVLGLRNLFERLVYEKIPQPQINGATKQRAPHIINLTFAGQDNERLMMRLDEAGIQCGVGSACSASREDVSQVLSAIGLSDESARSTLRFSLGRQTTKADIDQTVKELVRLLS